MARTWARGLVLITRRYGSVFIPRARAGDGPGQGALAPGRLARAAVPRRRLGVLEGRPRRGPGARGEKARGPEGAHDVQLISPRRRRRDLHASMAYRTDPNVLPLSKNNDCAQHYSFLLPKSRLNLIGAAPAIFFVWKPPKPGNAAGAGASGAGAGAA